MKALNFGKRYRYWLLLIATLAALYYAWGAITARQGDQKVSYRPAAKTCGESGALRYCIYRSVGGTNGDILYHLHGRGLDENIWNDDTYFTAMIQGQWQRTGVVPPTVVSVSYGGTWLLAAKGGKPDSGLLEDFMARLPAIEAKIGKPRRRILMGESMGGLNVLVAGLSYPSQFAKVASLCPGVYAISPFGPFKAMRETLARTGADPKIGFGVWMMARRYLASDAEWQRFSPLALIEKVSPGAPALYLSCGLYDAYGNYEGTQRLADRAKQRGLSVEWHPLYGGHCATDVPSLAAFLGS